jgi:hypothetical protein
MNKYEPTQEEIRENHDYQQAVKVAELVVVPDLSDDTANYLEAISQYKEITRHLNSITSNRFVDLDMNTLEPDIEEFNNNLGTLRDIEIEIRTARTLHDGIVSAIGEGLHATAIQEQADRYQMFQARNMITTNAYRAVKERLTEYNKTSEQLRKKREKASKA